MQLFKALSPWDDAEIRRRDKVYGKYEVVAKSSYNVKEYAPNITNIEVSISTGELNLTNTMLRQRIKYDIRIWLLLQYIFFYFKMVLLRFWI